MIYPNKNIRFEESIIYKMINILEITNQDISVVDLLNRTKKHFDNIDEFIYAIDVLFILDKIIIDFETNTIKYVKGN